MKETYEKRYPNLQIDITFTHQYQNMRDIIAKTPEVMDIAEKAMTAAGIPVIVKSIRGGTDGSRLTQLGFPTPNLFAGGMLFHSRKEWVAESSLLKSATTLIHLADHWSRA